MVVEKNIFFFIYDENAMNTEYDVLEDAVIYYHPKHFMSNNEMYLLIGQLVGMVTFTEQLSGSLIKILTLKSMKFTVHRHSHYLFFLGTSHQTIPDLSLQNKMERFVKQFKFYHGSIKRLLKRNKYNRADFLLDLDLICGKYLSLMTSASDTIANIFSLVNKLNIFKDKVDIFTSASQLLQSCQRKEKILCGCIFSENKLVCSQIPSELVAPLLCCLSQAIDNVAWKIYPGFEYPFGISIFKIYLSPEDSEKVLNQSKYSPYKQKDTCRPVQSQAKSFISENHVNSKLEDSFNASTSTTLFGDELQYDNCNCRSNMKPVFTTKFFSSTNEINSSLDRFPIVHHCKNNYEIHTKASENHHESSDYLKGTSSAAVDLEDCSIHEQAANKKPFVEKNNDEDLKEPCIGDRENTQIIKNSFESSGNTDVEKNKGTEDTQNPDCAKDFQTTNIDVQNETLEKPSHCFDEKSCENDLVSYAQDRVADFVLKSQVDNHASDELTLSRQGDLPNVLFKGQIVEQKQSTDDGIIVENEEVDDADDMNEFHLIVQSHSNTSIFLLMSPSEKYSKEYIKEIGEMMFTVLGDIEGKIKSSLSSIDSSNNSGGGKKINHSLCVRYDHINSLLQENIGDNSNEQQQFVDTVEQLHAQFTNASQFYDVTLKSVSSTVYAHQSPFDEMYIQPRGNYRPTQGAPNNTDIAWRLDQSISRKSDRNKIASYEGCQFVKSIF